jgi:hypothetical protein
MKITQLNLEKDYQDIRKMLQESFMKSTDFGVGALDYSLFMENEEELYESMRIWKDDKNRVCAIAWAGTQNLNYVCHPDHKDLESEIINDFENIFKEEGKEAIQKECFEEDKYRINILKKRGYQKDESSYHYFAVCDLSKSISDANLEKDYESRELLETYKEIEKRAELNKIAADFMDREQYMKMRTALSYKKDLDLVVVYDIERKV